MSSKSELPAKDFSLANTDQGIYRKFEVRRTDFSDLPGGKHEGCDYFVWDMTHDPHAKEAASAYADAVEATHPELAADMRARYGLTISQLAEQRAELLTEIERIADDYDPDKSSDAELALTEMREALCAAIAKATQQRKEI